jgi:hypothetical protein
VPCRNVQGGLAYKISASNFANSAGIALRYNLQTGFTGVVNTNANVPVGS